jgi:hypothetical protein
MQVQRRCRQPELILHDRIFHRHPAQKALFLVDECALPELVHFIWNAVAGKGLPAVVRFLLAFRTMLFDVTANCGGLPFNSTKRSIVDGNCGAHKIIVRYDAPRRKAMPFDRCNTTGSLILPDLSRWNAGDFIW